MPVRVAIVYNQPEPVASRSHWLSRSERVGSALPATFHDPSEYAILEQVRGIERTLREAAGNISRAAALLGLSRQALYRKMERLGIEMERRPRD